MVGDEVAVREVVPDHDAVEQTVHDRARHADRPVNRDALALQLQLVVVDLVDDVRARRHAARAALVDDDVAGLEVVRARPEVDRVGHRVDDPAVEDDAELHRLRPGDDQRVAAAVAEAADDCLPLPVVDDNVARDGVVDQREGDRVRAAVDLRPGIEGAVGDGDR